MDSNYWDHAAKQLEGKASPTEQEALRRWLAEDPAHQRQYEEQQRLWALTSPPPAAEVDTEVAWQKVRERTLSGRKQPKQVALWPMAGIAASLAILIGLAWLARLFFFPYYGMEVIASGTEQRMFILPDSSQVWLNKNSKLLYHPAGGAERAVVLIGEAFFEVKHNPQRPFTVETAEALTTVLGTSFNLRAYPEEETTELWVATGKVAFAAEDRKAQTLVPAGYAAILQKQANTISKFQSLTENAWAWKSGTLAFRDQPLGEVIPLLERYYGVSLRVQNSQLANCRFTGSFRQAELEEVLRVLEATLQLDYSQINNQTYTISGPGCSE